VLQWEASVSDALNLPTLVTNSFDLKAVVHDCKVVGSTTEDGDEAKHACGT